MSEIKRAKVKESQKPLNFAPFRSETGLELVINVHTGETYASIRATARIVDRPHQTIHDFAQKCLDVTSQADENATFESVRWESLLGAEIQTPAGLRSVRLLNETQILDVIEHYSPRMLRTFAQAGLRLYLHKLTGYEYRSPTDAGGRSALADLMWGESRQKGKPFRSDYQLFVSHRANVAHFTNKVYESLFASNAKFLKDNLPRVKGSKKIARNYIPSGRELNALALLESVVVSYGRIKEEEIGRKVTADELWDLHTLAIDVVFNAYAQNRILV